MSVLALEQALNGLQFGLMLFLLAAGLTLVFGVMDMINLAHGSLYMVGAFLGAWIVGLDRLVRRRPRRRGARHRRPSAWRSSRRCCARFYGRDHLSQVLATFALILILNDGTRMLFGNDLPLSAPAALDGPVQLLPGLAYPAYRSSSSAPGSPSRSCSGCSSRRRGWARLVRAGAANREMATGDGRRHPAPLHDRVRHRRGPVRGRRRADGAAARGAGRHGREHPDPRLRRHRHRRHRLDPRRASSARSSSASSTPSAGTLLQALFREFLPPQMASAAGPAVASVAIYVFMAAVLAIKPQGLFPARG
jgi:branched-chain amino acid transport system permease protein